jgi:tetratricopeptide (TPR) repeat protein
MYCPECGNDAGEAKFCPECGADLAGLKSAMKGKTTSQAASGKGGGGQRPPKEPAAAGAAAAPAQQGGRGLSPAMIWAGFGVLAVIVIVVVVMASGGFSGKSSGGSSAAATSATPIMGVVNGTYATLVQKGNEFFDLGQTQFTAKKYDQGIAYFQAAAMTYAAAWRKQHTDPSVGTDYATSLFYSGNIPAAIKQAQSVLKADPAFQSAWYNLGNFYAHQQALAAQKSQTVAAKKARALAVAAYTRAIAINATNDVGKSADQNLKQLPK